MKSQALNWFKLVISSTTGHLELGFQVFFPSHAPSDHTVAKVPFAFSVFTNVGWRETELVESHLFLGKGNLLKFKPIFSLGSKLGSASHPSYTDRKTH